MLFRTFRDGVRMIWVEVDLEPPHAMIEWPVQEIADRILGPAIQNFFSIID